MPHHQTMFRGATQVTLDAKGRMVLPTRYRERILERCQGQLVVLEGKLMRLPTMNEASRKLQRLMVGHATDVELDAAGRLLLPPKLREFAALERDVVLVGQGNRFELWDEPRWNQSRDAWLAEDTALPTDMPADLGNLSI